MAVAHVQTRDDFATNNTQVQTYTATAITATAGNLRIFVVAGLHTGTLTPTLSDGIGTSFVQIGTTFYNGSEGYPLSMWYAKNCAGGSSAIKADWGTGNTVSFPNIIQTEVSGADLVAPLDGTNFLVANRQAAPGTATDVLTSTATGAYSTTSIYLFAYSILVTGAVPTITAGTNWTQRLNDSAGGQSTEEYLPGSTTGIAATFTPSVGSGNFYTGIAAFIPAVTPVIAVPREFPARHFGPF